MATSRVLKRVCLASIIVLIPTLAIAGSVLVPPATVTANSSTPAFAATNNGSGLAINAFSISGQAIKGTSKSLAGILGLTTNTSTSISTAGVVGSDFQNTTSSNAGVLGKSTLGTGVLGTSTKGTGVLGTSTNGTGVVGTTTSFIGVSGNLNDPNSLGSPTGAVQSGVIGTDNTGQGFCSQNICNDLSTLPSSGIRGTSWGGTGVYGGNGFTDISYSCESCGPAGIGVVGSDSIGVAAQGGIAGLFLPMVNANPTLLLASFGDSRNFPQALLEWNTNPSTPEVSFSITGTLSAGVGGFGVPAGEFTNPASALASDPLVRGYGNICSSTGKYEVFEFDSAGDLVLCGSVTQFGQPMTAVRTTTGVQAVAYEPRQAEPTIEDVGGGQMANGVGYVAIDPRFRSTMDPRFEYRVFITPEGDNRGLYVTQKTPEGFTVHESQGGHATIAFDYRIVAKPWDSNAPRLPLVRSLKQMANFYNPKPSAIMRTIASWRSRLVPRRPSQKPPSR